MPLLLGDDRPEEMPMTYISSTTRLFLSHPLYVFEFSPPKNYCSLGRCLFSKALSGAISSECIDVDRVAIVSCEQIATPCISVIEHRRYDHKADVFSFGIVFWELLTGQIPYERYTPLQAAVGVVQKGLRPTIPKNTNPKLAKLLEECWQQDPRHRPDFRQFC